jgi:hypothetical protein
MQTDPRQREIHWLDEEGRVACNLRDKEAAHRAQVEGNTTEILSDVTCRNCLGVLRERQQK